MAEFGNNTHTKLNQFLLTNSGRIYQRKLAIRVLSKGENF